ncbi:MAG: hypothetical protein Q4E60_11305 [Bacteroidales bacterium]|nr:hypothetical protein [Bacteroidales bacterium]
MKHIITIIICLMVSLSMHAQKVKVQDTQARLLDVTSSGYVKPLTVELKVDTSKGRVRDVWPLSKEQVEVEFKSDLANIRSYAVYMSSKKHDADVIVAATFNFKSNANGDGYEIELVGYPANFVNWKTAGPEDYEWIRMEKDQLFNEQEKSKSSKRK